MEKEGKSKKGLIIILIVILAVILFFAMQIITQKMAVNDGIDYLADKEYEKAYQSFEKAEGKITIFTSKSNILYYEGECLMDLERFDEAAKVYEEIDENRALVLKGLALLQDGQEEEAVDAYRQAIDADAEDGMAYYYLYAYYLSKDDAKTALSVLDEAKEANVSNMKQEIDYARIVVYEKLLKYDQALSEAESYVEAYPDDEKGQQELEFLETR